MEHTVYETGQTILQPGEPIFLYTDGVTEALNTREELFSDDRLRKKITFLQYLGSFVSSFDNMLIF